MKRKTFNLSPDKNSSLIKIKNQHNSLINKQKWHPEHGSNMQSLRR